MGAVIPMTVSSFHAANDVVFCVCWEEGANAALLCCLVLQRMKHVCIGWKDRETNKSNQ